MVRGQERAREAQEQLWQQLPVLAAPQREQQMLLMPEAGMWQTPSYLQPSWFPGIRAIS